MTDVFRSEHWELSWGKEATYGTDPGTALLVNPFGVFDRGQLADPEVEYTPFYGAGGCVYRRYFRAYPGKWAMEANIGDIMMLDAKALVFPFGTVVTAGAGAPYTHTITEATTLPSLTMHATNWDASTCVTPALMRRFIGGKVSRCTISAEEGDRLKMNLDSILFKDITHNIVAETVKYSADVAKPTLVYPSDEPYFFSGGVLQIGTTGGALAQFARARSVRIDINNNCEAKYYIAGQSNATPIPYTILEGKREYTITCKIDIEDTTLYQELIKMGKSAGVPIGIALDFKVSRSATDYIQFKIPSGTPSITNQGCFIKRARIDLDSSSGAVPQELELIARSIEIEVKDADDWSEFA